MRFTIWRATWTSKIELLKQQVAIARYFLYFPKASMLRRLLIISDGRRIEQRTMLMPLEYLSSILRRIAILKRSLLARLPSGRERPKSGWGTKRGRLLCMMLRASDTAMA